MRTGACIVLSLLGLPAASQEEEAEKVFRLAGASVVGLRNAETSGTGILMNDQGLILTNAHVVASPLPYRVQVEARTGKTTETLEFKSFQVSGVHPKYDLALVKIDPKEHKIKLSPARIAKSKGSPGKRVYAIGNPTAGGTTFTKTITSGMLSAVDRQMDGLPYYQISAPVNPGNSGGPVCDKDGQVLGLVTFKVAEAEGIGFAVPLHDLKTDAFVPLTRRAGNHAKARELIDAAEKFNAVSRRYAEQFGLEDERRLEANFIACLLYRMALTEMPDSPDLYYNIGMLWRTLDVNEVAAGYLVRCIQMQPWCDAAGNPYRELGYALLKDKKRKEAFLAWTEGTRKVPATGGKIWEDLAIYHIEEQNFSRSAWCAQAALRTGDCRADVMKRLFQDARSRLPAADARTLDEDVQAIPETLKTLQEEAEKARAAKKDFLLPEFSAFLRSYGDAPKEGPGPAAQEPAKPRETPARSADDAAAAWIRSKLALARNYRNTGLNDNALKILAEIVAKYPDHASTAEARKLQQDWKR